MPTAKDYELLPDGSMRLKANAKITSKPSKDCELSNRGGVGYKGVSEPNANSPDTNPLTPVNNANKKGSMLTPLTDGNLYQSLVLDIDRFLEGADYLTFTIKQLDEAINLPKEDRKAQTYRSVILGRMCPHRLERLSYARYREIQTSLRPLNWQDADLEDILKLNYPLGMQKLIKTYKGCILVCAGVTHAGKTALSYDFILKNLNNPMGIHLFSTGDMDEVEIKERFGKSGVFIPNPAPFQVWEMPENPSDLTQKDAINVFDGIDLNSDTYLIGDVLDKIQAKLGRGFAWVNIQKREGQKLGVGGLFSIKRSKIYFGLDIVQDGNELFHQLTIEKCRGRTNPEVNPVGRYYKFKLVDGIKIFTKEEG